jgi:hypothetical protein
MQFFPENLESEISCFIFDRTFSHKLMAPRTFSNKSFSSFDSNLLVLADQFLVFTASAVTQKKTFPTEMEKVDHYVFDGQLHQFPFFALYRHVIVLDVNVKLISVICY